MARRSTAALRVELERALTVADRANNAVLQERDGRWMIQGDPRRGPSSRSAQSRIRKPSCSKTRFKRVAEVPFSSERKLMSTVHEDAKQQKRLLVFTKGAPDVLLERCAQESVGGQPTVNGRAARRNSASE